jgi:glycerol-3-phosphate acyltransferase PlsY
MENIPGILLLIVCAYLIGAIPASIWIGKIFFSKDIRDFGSGNAGASNAVRVFGARVGLAVLVFDVLKGFLALQLVYFINVAVPGTEKYITIRIFLGISAILGHIYPVYAGFRGGKGVATVFGVLLALHPLATLTAAGFFLAGLLVTGFSSVGSLLAGIIFPILIIFVFRSPYISLQIFSVLVTLILIFTHRKNIKRLLNGTENKTSFRSVK